MGGCGRRQRDYVEDLNSAMRAYTASAMILPASLRAMIQGWLATPESGAESAPNVATGDGAPATPAVRVPRWWRTEPVPLPVAPAAFVAGTRSLCWHWAGPTTGLFSRPRPWSQSGLIVGAAPGLSAEETMYLQTVAHMDDRVRVLARLGVAPDVAVGTRRRARRRRRRRRCVVWITRC